MTAPYGVPADHDNRVLLTALLRERYGDLRDLEKERFTTVPVRAKPRPVIQPGADIPAELGDLHMFELTIDLQRRDRLMRGDAA